MALQILKQDDGRRRGLHADWNAWLEQADKLYYRILERLESPPFYFHEVASAGFLASAAALSGFIPLAEYQTVKLGKHDRRRKVGGRADLWFASPERAYSFEIKRSYGKATLGNLQSLLKAAENDISCIPDAGYSYASGLLIATVFEPEREKHYLDMVETKDVDLAYRIGPSGENGAYLYFKLKC